MTGPHYEIGSEISRDNLSITGNLKKGTFAIYVDNNCVSSWLNLEPWLVLRCGTELVGLAIYEFHFFGPRLNN